MFPHKKQQSFNDFETNVKLTPLSQVCRDFSNFEVIKDELPLSDLNFIQDSRFAQNFQENPNPRVESFEVLRPRECQDLAERSKFSEYLCDIIDSSKSEHDKLSEEYVNLLRSNDNPNSSD